MQTIARANRITSARINNVRKTNGEVVDYYNVFRNMKKALAAYALGNDEEPPAREKYCGQSPSFHGDRIF